MTTQATYYDFKRIEANWQAFWKQNKTFKAIDGDTKPKYYALDMLPYPSGAGLHIGHPEGYTATDILSRTKKAQGYNVLHPMGWDAFGLPAEQHALATGIDPKVNTAQNISVFKRQLESLGFAFDWDREIDTTHPHFYKWTQWIFLQLFKKGLAYVDEKPVWWCQALGTALANEEVIDGRSERGNHPVERRNLRQWVLRITAFAQKLLDDLDTLDWPDSTKRQQIAWIGKSEGATLHFDIKEKPGLRLSTFTTRIDTVYGISFIAIAPEHPLAHALTTKDNLQAVQAYIQEASSKSDLVRTQLEKDKTGIFSGSYAIHPLTQEPIPIWIADYVLNSYATGAVIGVPAHDERDYHFATKYNLKIQRVITSQEDPTNEPLPYLGSGNLIHSASYNGMDNEKAKAIITSDLAAIQRAEKKVQYKLRDWLFSRQRYWGEPFPIIWVQKEDFQKILHKKSSPFHEFLPEDPVWYQDNDGKAWYAVPLPSSALPLLLPHVESYKPSGLGESPLANAKDWVTIQVNIQTGEVLTKNQTPCQDCIHARRETNTMPQWAGSSWYYLRYLDPHNQDALIDKKVESYWSTPDIYIGGAEHAVLHLLYARFWHKVLYEIGIVSSPEPFKRLVHQGLILGELEFTAFYDENQMPISAQYVSATHTDTRTQKAVSTKAVSPQEVLKQGDYFVLKQDPSIRVDARAHKMSKSRGNVVNPDTIIQEYGADALRLYEMFLGPLEASKPWNTNGIEGISRFLKKIFRECIEDTGKVSSKLQNTAEKPETLKALHLTIKKVTEDIEALRFNTAISQMMIFINHIQKMNTVKIATMSTFLQLLAPFAPHIAEELWAKLGNTPSISNAPWPTYNESLLQETTIKIILQINGKMRGEVFIDAKTDSKTLLELVRNDPKINHFLKDKTIVKEIYVPNKVLNLVVV